MSLAVRRCTIALLLLIALVMTLATVAGCGSPGGVQAQTPYCVDAQGTVYPPIDCDGGSHLGMPSAAFFYMLGTWSHPYGYGQRINVTNIHVTRISANDPAARARYGMPARGPATSSYRYTPPRTSGTSRSGFGTTTRRSSGFGSSLRSTFRGTSSFRSGRR